jgi:hypothetical protein
MVKDTEGTFQGQPLTVKMDGGSFIPAGGTTTLMSLTFQAPPDRREPPAGRDRLARQSHLRGTTRC